MSLIIKIPIIIQVHNEKVTRNKGYHNDYLVGMKQGGSRLRIALNSEWVSTCAT